MQEAKVVLFFMLLAGLFMLYARPKANIWL
jgi:hypothetical protein